MKLLTVMPSRTMAQAVTAATIAIGTSGSGSSIKMTRLKIPNMSSAASAIAHMDK